MIDTLTIKRNDRNSIFTCLENHILVKMLLIQVCQKVLKKI